jgi:hypothetical protein
LLDDGLAQPPNRAKHEKRQRKEQGNDATDAALGQRQQSATPESEDRHEIGDTFGKENRSAPGDGNLQCLF